jgi:hypothetical protein
MTFTKNIGHRDSQLRTVVAAVVIVVAMVFVENPWVRILLALVSAALATTAYFHSCYLYKLLGLHTLEGKVVHMETKAVDATPSTPAPVVEKVEEPVTAPDSEKTT